MSSNDWGDLSPNRQLTIFGLKWWTWLIIAAIVIGATFFALNWLNAGVKVISPDNVRAQFQQGYDDYNALQQTANNVCQAIKDENATTAGSNEHSQRTSQRIAYQQNYNRIAGEYNAFMSDPFRAKLVRPGDLPAQAPALEIMLTQVHCSVQLPS